MAVGRPYAWARALKSYDEATDEIAKALQLVSNVLNMHSIYEALQKKIDFG